jgi:hypothetical protein
MENAARLYRRQNHPQKNAQAPDTGGLFTRLTAEFRINLKTAVDAILGPSSALL